jgi:hypothetical protein
MDFLTGVAEIDAEEEMYRQLRVESTTPLEKFSE